MKFILGKKIEMTQRFRENGEVVPLTLVKAGPCVIVQVKTKDKDGYQSVQIGFGEKKKINKALKGHLSDLGNFQYLKEFEVDNSEFKKGDKIDVSTFQPGDKVIVSGTSKGKGFQGVVKRHGFHGSPKTHGHKDQLRMPGSIGSTGPQRVFKGVRMGGRMGGDRVTIKNLEIIEVLPEENIILLKGAVPGARNSLLEIRSIK
ncbi:MAG: large subunit ribosomal protein L3 [Parcubacteria group bacterium Athens1014_10]|nr:MAG: large subunit ribosomal protein L3 [Parcubacteria group bacterium Athens1014_10]TSD05499.1 MAG: large subunit ribosomal protein L3 [Parcubacteria group bacterium Athens0714_12]